MLVPKDTMRLPKKNYHAWQILGFKKPSVPFAYNLGWLQIAPPSEQELTKVRACTAEVHNLDLGSINSTAEINKKHQQ